MLPAKQNLRILIVEDDPSTTKALVQLFSHYGYETDHAPSIGVARMLLDGNPSHLVLDLTLPDGDGSALINEARSRRPNLRITIITGTADATRLRRVHALKPDVILTKPINFLDLLKCLRPAA